MKVFLLFFILVLNVMCYEDVRAFILSSSRDWISQGYQVVSLGAFKSNNFGISENTVNLIVDEANRIGSATYGGIDQTSFVLLKDISSQKSVGALTKTAWEQGVGFDKFTGGVLLGCVPVAIGQIMKYYQYPTSFNWSLMKDDVATDATALFLKEVGESCNIDYSKKDPGASVNDAYGAFKHYGYKNVTIVNHDYNSYNDIEGQLNRGRVIFMSGERNGSGHT